MGVAKYIFITKPILLIRWTDIQNVNLFCEMVLKRIDCHKDSITDTDISVL